jgi:hypothetical protein
MTDYGVAPLGFLGKNIIPPTTNPTITDFGWPPYLGYWPGIQFKISGTNPTYTSPFSIQCDDDRIEFVIFKFTNAASYFQRYVWDFTGKYFTATDTINIAGGGNVSGAFYCKKESADVYTFYYKNWSFYSLVAYNLDIKTTTIDCGAGTCTDNGVIASIVCPSDAAWLHHNVVDQIIVDTDIYFLHKRWDSFYYPWHYGLRVFKLDFTTDTLSEVADTDWSSPTLGSEATESFGSVLGWNNGAVSWCTAWQYRDYTSLKMFVCQDGTETTLYDEDNTDQNDEWACTIVANQYNQKDVIFTLTGRHNNFTVYPEVITPLNVKFRIAVLPDGTIVNDESNTNTAYLAPVATFADDTTTAVTNKASGPLSNYEVYAVDLSTAESDGVLPRVQYGFISAVFPVPDINGDMLMVAMNEITGNNYLVSLNTTTHLISKVHGEIYTSSYGGTGNHGLVFIQQTSSSYIYIAVWSPVEMLPPDDKVQMILEMN